MFFPARLKKQQASGSRNAIESGSVTFAPYTVASIFIGLLLNPAARVGKAEPDNSLIEAPKVQLTAQQLFDLAGEATARGDVATAEAAYRALANDSNTEIRSEALFRLGMLTAALGRNYEAARMFRRILDEKPNAQRVRLEFARVLAAMGDDTGARRALREAQAGGLPPDVALFVDRYSAALRSRKPLGASFEFALAPDSNINRATRSDTLGTVLGDFTLDEDAQEKSGVGVALRGQIYGRMKVSGKTNLLARASGAADIYGRSDFNDLALGLTAGPEFQLGQDRVTVEAGATWRWFGNEPFSTTATLSLNYLHPLDRQSQIRVVSAFGNIDNKRNPLQDGQNYALSVSYERALSSASGVGVTLTGDRNELRNPGYSTTGGQLSIVGYHDFGAFTLIGSLGYGRLKADERLFIYPSRRSDSFYRASLGATFRQLSIGQFAPLVRVSIERNTSSIEVFNYRRVRTEIGLTRAF